MRKFLTAALLLSFTLGLSSCKTTRDDRIEIGTIVGAGVGVGIGLAAGGSILPGLAIGASSGAVLAVLSE